VRPRGLDALRSGVEAESFASLQPAAQHKAGTGSTAEAVDKHTLTISSKGCDIVKDVIKYEVELRVTVVVDEKREALEVMREAIDISAQRNDSEVTVAATSAVEITRPNPGYPLDRSNSPSWLRPAGEPKRRYLGSPRPRRCFLC
jgi:hypothetical protein